jgi:hypothetical protein
MVAVLQDVLMMVLVAVTINQSSQISEFTIIFKIYITAFHI